MRNIAFLLLSIIFTSSCSVMPGMSGHQGQQPPINQASTWQPDEREIIKRYPPPKPLEDNSSKVFATGIEPIKVALLIPMSGKFKELGKNILDAAQLAMFSIDENNLTLIPIDTEGTSFGAAAAARSAVAQGADIILGPIFSSSAKSVEPIAREAGISVISFSNDKSLASSGVFALGHRPDEQFTRIIEFSMGQGVEDYTAVVPNNEYGAIAAKSLRETTAQNKRFSVLRTEIYMNDNTGSPIKLNEHVFSAYSAAVNTKPMKDYNEKSKTFNEDPIKYPRGFLLPEGGIRLKQMTRLLEEYKYNPLKVQFLGTEQWLEDETLSNPVLQGAWVAAPASERQFEFEKNFMDTYGYKSKKLGNLAYDGVALIATLAHMSGGKDFSHSALANPRGFIGVDGIFRFKENGLAERGIAVLRINNGQVEIIDKSPTSFVDFQSSSSDESDEPEDD